MLSLTACNSVPVKETSTKIVPVPKELVQTVPEPQLEGKTNSALIDLIERLRHALKLANDKLEKIGEL